MRVLFALCFAFCPAVAAAEILRADQLPPLAPLAVSLPVTVPGGAAGSPLSTSHAALHGRLLAVDGPDHLAETGVDFSLRFARLAIDGALTEARYTRGQDVPSGSPSASAGLIGARLWLLEHGANRPAVTANLHYARELDAQGTAPPGSTLRPSFSAGWQRERWSAVTTQGLEVAWLGDTRRLGYQGILAGTLAVLPALSVTAYSSVFAGDWARGSGTLALLAGGGVQAGGRQLNLGIDAFSGLGHDGRLRFGRYGVALRVLTAWY